MLYAERWRLFVEPPRDGPFNMAIDEAILEAVGRGQAPPTLRLYRWIRPCLSLGYAQPASDADRERLQARGWQIVRRMTGGRAILHTDELTYSVTLPIGHPLASGSIVESYRRLSKGLLAALERLGLAAGAEKRAQAINGSSKAPICFEVPSDYEITANGKKLVGSAQVRKQNGLLQHGTLPLEGDVTRICDALRFEGDAARQSARERMRARATTFAESAGFPANWEQAAEAMIAAFAETFEITLAPETLSAVEINRAEKLCISRYAHENWTSLVRKDS